MNTAVITFQTFCPDGFHIIVYKLKVYLGVISHLNRLLEEFLKTSLLFQSLIDFFPCAVFAAVYFTFAVFRTAALSVDQTLGTVNDRTDASGYIQIALGTCITLLLSKRHAVIASVIQGIAGRIYGFSRQIRHCLDSQSAGDHKNILCAFRDQILDFLFCLDFVA